jgi:hypothetical protein
MIIPAARIAVMTTLECTFPFGIYGMTDASTYMYIYAYYILHYKQKILLDIKSFENRYLRFVSDEFLALKDAHLQQNFEYRQRIHSLIVPFVHCQPNDYCD